MESKEMQRLRYHAKKYGLRCLRVAEGYRIYRAADGKLVDSVNGFYCNKIFSRAGLADFLSTLTAAKNKVCCSMVAAAKI